MMIDQGKNRSLKVVLINLPWASYRRPSIQLGLLSELARKHGHLVEQAHLNLNLAAQIGIASYEPIAEHRSMSLGNGYSQKLPLVIRHLEVSLF